MKLYGLNGNFIPNVFGHEGPARLASRFLGAGLFSAPIRGDYCHGMVKRFAYQKRKGCNNPVIGWILILLFFFGLDPGDRRTTSVFGPPVPIASSSYESF